MRAVLLAGVLALGCATAVSPYGTTRAVGAHARSAIYLCPEIPEEAVRTVKVNEPATLELGFVDHLRRLFGGDAKLPRKTTETQEPAALAGCQLVQESRGSGFLEPLAKVIAEGGVAIGNAGGCAVLRVLTLGWRGCSTP